MTSADHDVIHGARSSAIVLCVACWRSGYGIGLAIEMWMAWRNEFGASIFIEHFW